MRTKKRNSAGATRLEMPKPDAGKMRKVKFHMHAPAKSKVFVAGSFNDWDAVANRLRHNGNSTYVANIMLPPGRHEYKFVVDGEWLVDTENPQWASNNMGSLNSVMEV